MTEQKKHLTKSDRFKVMLRSQLLQGSWNYERMQNGGWAYSLIPALKKLYPQREDASAALKRHLEFFNTHPYIAAPILGNGWLYFSTALLLRSMECHSCRLPLVYARIWLC